jgi:hypothetical protein
VVVLHATARQQRQFDADVTLADLGAAQWATAVRACIDTRLDLEVPARLAGSWCRHCDLLATCDPGRVETLAHPARPGGLPPLR